MGRGLTHPCREVPVLQFPVPSRALPCHLRANSALNFPSAQEDEPWGLVCQKSQMVPQEIPTSASSVGLLCLTLSTDPTVSSQSGDFSLPGAFASQISLLLTTWVRSALGARMEVRGQLRLPSTTTLLWLEPRGHPSSGVSAELV